MAGMGMGEKSHGCSTLQSFVVYIALYSNFCIWTCYHKLHSVNNYHDYYHYQICGFPPSQTEVGKGGIPFQKISSFQNSESRALL